MPQSPAALPPMASLRQAASRPPQRRQQTLRRMSFSRNGHPGSAGAISNAWQLRRDSSRSMVLLPATTGYNAQPLSLSVQRLQRFLHQPGDAPCARKRQEAHQKGELPCTRPRCSEHSLQAPYKQVACCKTCPKLHGLELQAQAARGAVSNGTGAAAQQSSQPTAIDSLTNGAHPSQAEPDAASGAQPLAAASSPNGSAAAAPAANSNGEQVKCCIRNGSDMVSSVCRRRQVQHLGF